MSLIGPQSVDLVLQSWIILALNKWSKMLPGKKNIEMLLSKIKREGIRNKEINVFYEDLDLE